MHEEKNFILSFILSMLIPGPECIRDAIDVYLQPLIDELKELWETGVFETFDGSAKQNLRYMHLCYGPLIIFQHMEIRQDGVPKENYLARVAIEKLFQLGW